MTRVGGSLYPRQVEIDIREAISALRMLEFDADDPDYNPNDTALLEIHCRVKPEPGPHGSG